MLCVFTLFVAPGSVIISMSKTAFQTTISWSPPERPNGIIIAYEVSYLQTANPHNVTRINTTDQVISLSLCRLQPRTQYTFSVRAFTQAGAGEESVITYTTSDQPGNFNLIPTEAMLAFILPFAEVFIQLHLNGIFSCKRWVVRQIWKTSTVIIFTIALFQESDVMEKQMDISSTISQVVQDSCQCRYGQSEIDREVFHCFDGSENSVTYRARLLATADVDIQSLTSYLEEWVAGGNSIVVGGVNLVVNKDCSVEIADLLQQEEGCTVESARSGINGVAVATSVGGTVLIACTVTVAVVTIVILWRRR